VTGRLLAGYRVAALPATSADNDFSVDRTSRLVRRFACPSPGVLAVSVRKSHAGQP
jgi:hypothetical protein